MTEATGAIILLSLKVALLATLMCLPVAILLAHLLARRQFRGKALVSALIHLPLVLPPVVTGYVLLVALGRNGFLGAPLFALTGFTFAFRWTGAALAAGLMALPIYVQSIRIAMEAYDTELELAAADLGASPWRVFWRITLPMATPGLIAGTVLCFVKALGEFGATITFVSNIPGETQTLSLAIYTLLQTPNGDAAAWVLMGLSVAMSFAALFAADIASRGFARRLRTQS